MNNSVSTFVGRSVTLAAATILLCSPGWGQQRQPIQRNLITIVKPDRVADFEAAVKLYNEVYAKTGGARARLEYQSLTGPTEFRLVRSYNDWAEMDAPLTTNTNAELARILARITSCIEHSTTVISEIVPELTLPRVATPPVLLRISRLRVAPAKVDEWMAIMKNEVVPAYKKAGISLTVRRARMGAPSNEFYISTRAANWAEAGTSSMAKALGQEAYQKLLPKLNAITTQLEVNIYRYRADLSWSPPAN